MNGINIFLKKANSRVFFFFFFGFVGHTVSVITVQFCHSVKASVNTAYVNKCGSIPVKFYLQKLVVCHIWSLYPISDQWANGRTDIK